MCPLISPTISTRLQAIQYEELDGKDTTGLYYLDVKESTEDNQHYSLQQARIGLRGTG